MIFGRFLVNFKGLSSIFLQLGVEFWPSLAVIYRKKVFFNFSRFFGDFFSSNLAKFNLFFNCLAYIFRKLDQYRHTYLI